MAFFTKSDAPTIVSPTWRVRSAVLRATLTAVRAVRFGFATILATADFFFERFAVDFLAADFLAVDFFPVDFLALDFLAVDLLALDFRVDFLAAVRFRLDFFAGMCSSKIGFTSHVPNSGQAQNRRYGNGGYNVTQI